MTWHPLHRMLFGPHGQFEPIVEISPSPAFFETFIVFAQYMTSYVVIDTCLSLCLGWVSECWPVKMAIWRCCPSFSRRSCDLVPCRSASIFERGWVCSAFRRGDKCDAGLSISRLSNCRLVEVLLVVDTLSTSTDSYSRCSRLAIGVHCHCLRYQTKWTRVHNVAFCHCGGQK